MVLLVKSAIYRYMKIRFKNLLVNILVLMVIMLPLRNVFAMPLDMSSIHCDTDMRASHSNMQKHADHSMLHNDKTNSGMEEKSLACTCCSQCDGDCTGCVHISSAITLDFFQISSLKIIESVSLDADSLLTRAVSPPSRPPLIL